MLTAPDERRSCSTGAGNRHAPQKGTDQRCPRFAGCDNAARPDRRGRLLIYMVNPWFVPPEWICRCADHRVLGRAHRPARRCCSRTASRRAPSSVEVEGPAFTRFLSATRGPACSGCRSACSSASRSSRPACTSSSPRARPSAPAGWTAAHRCSATGRTPRPSPSAPARPAITFEWYRELPHLLIANNAQLVRYPHRVRRARGRAGLIFGVLTGIAAFFGAS